MVSGYIVAANGAPSYSQDVRLYVPITSGYRAMVAYRSSSGAAWGPRAYSTGGTFSVAPAMIVTAPTGSGSYVRGSSLQVMWTVSVATSTGEFGVFVENGGLWYLGYIVPANGASSFYTQNVSLYVPVASGYRAMVAYRPSSADPWGPRAYSTGGTFSVTP